MAEITASNPSNTLMQRLAAVEPAQRWRMMAGLVLMVVLLVLGGLMSQQAEWRVLYANLADKDGGAIIAQLSQLNIPYKHAEGGSAILVPADKVHDTRLKLASLGLPKSSVTGFEMVEANRLGMTQFQERLSFQRGLEGELTRSIQALSSVANARVHLALPQQNGFFREQQKPSASVLLSLHGGRTLERTQIAGIVHLVASSVPEMSPQAVSVLDDTGKLLSGAADAQGGIDAQQLQYVQQIEQIYSRRIMDMLEPLVGLNNVRAQVTVDVDFSQTEQTSESHKPNQTPEQSVIRSQQLVESTQGGVSAAPSGVPGATTNQPPSNSSAPINGSAQNLSAANAQSAGPSKRESLINYEVDKTVKVMKGSSGTIRRLSAGVVLNHTSITDDKGRTTQSPLSDEQLKQMTALVKESVGFNAERGDSVNLMNAPFAREKSQLMELPLWKQPMAQELIRSLVWPLVTLLLTAVVILGLVKPGLKALAEPPVQVGVELDTLKPLEAVVQDDPELTALLPTGAPALAAPAPSASELALEDARKLTRDNPVAVANIVKTWVNGEAPA
jgi:flagellar M-ring protein FliF